MMNTEPNPTESDTAVQTDTWMQSSAQLPARFDYEHTRTVEVDSTTLKNNRVVSAVEPGHFSNAYKIMRTQVLQKMRENGWNTLGITSPGRSEGKSQTAINLAISLAMEVNHTVLLVDADMRHPSIANRFGIQSEAGLTECLLDRVEISELLINPRGIDRFVMLPGGRPIHNAGEILSSHMMVDFINDVKSRYPARIVIFDLPSVLISGESASVAPHLDAVMLVAESGKTRNDDLLKARKMLGAANLIGTALSKSPDPIRNI